MRRPSAGLAPTERAALQFWSAVLVAGLVYTRMRKIRCHLPRMAFEHASAICFIEANPAYDKLVSNNFNRVIAGMTLSSDL